MYSSSIPTTGKIVLTALLFCGAVGTVYGLMSAAWSAELLVIGLFAAVVSAFRYPVKNAYIDISGPLIIGCLVSGFFSLEDLFIITVLHQIPRLFHREKLRVLKFLANSSEGIISITAAYTAWVLLKQSGTSLLSVHNLLASIVVLGVYLIVNIILINLLVCYVYPRPSVTYAANLRNFFNVGIYTTIIQYVFAVLLAGVLVDLNSSIFVVCLALFLLLGILVMSALRTWVQKTSLDEQLRTNQEFLHDLIANMDDALIAYDSEGMIVHINAAAQRLVKEPVERGDLIGETPFQPLLAIKEHDTSEYNLNGRLLRVRKIPVSTTSSGNTGVVLLFEDITERKVIEDYAMHKDRLTLLGEFSAGIMHEIGKPLTMLSVAYDEIAATGLTDKNLEILGRSIDKLADLSRQLLNFSKPSPGRGKTMTNITQILTETVGIAELLAKKKRINIEIDAGYELIADIDEHEVRQVLLNLISNAIDVTPASGTISFAVGSGSFTDASESIWVRDYRAGRQSQGWFSVADQGPGFADEVIARLGNSFVTTKSEGHGLGFSIVLLLIKRWNARMSIYRLAPSGSRIVVEV